MNQISTNTTIAIELVAKLTYAFIVAKALEVYGFIQFVSPTIGYIADGVMYFNVCMSLLFMASVLTIYWGGDRTQLEKLLPAKVMVIFTTLFTMTLYILAGYAIPAIIYGFVYLIVFQVRFGMMAK